MSGRVGSFLRRRPVQRRCARRSLRALPALRDLGPVVWLEAHDVYAVTRYEDVRAVLTDAETFCSGQGVGLNDVFNVMGRGSTLMSDGDDHRRLRNVIGRPLTPKALAELQPEAQHRAEELADRLVKASSFDAVRDLAEVLPTTWVPDLLGWPDESREKLLDWATATFDGFGPPNERTSEAATGMLEMAAFAGQVALSELPEGSMAAGILEASLEVNSASTSATWRSSTTSALPSTPRSAASATPSGCSPPIRSNGSASERIQGAPGSPSTRRSVWKAR